MSSQASREINYLAYPDEWWNYSRHNHSLRIIGSPLIVGQKIVYKAYCSLLLKDTGEAWNNKWLKDYTTALFKYQYGFNLSKFSGLTLPDGTEFNGEMFMTQGKEEIEQLKEDLFSMYTEQPGMYIG